MICSLRSSRLLCSRFFGRALHDIPKTAVEETSIVVVDRKGGEEGGEKKMEGSPSWFFLPYTDYACYVEQFLTSYYTLKSPQLEN